MTQNYMFHKLSNIRNEKIVVIKVEKSLVYHS